jgi:hypothetical protein
MRRTIGRRPIFFTFAALVCVLLVPATPNDLRWVTWATAGLGALWGILLAVEDLSAVQPKRKERVPPPPETPFEPPPPPGYKQG